MRRLTRDDLHQWLDGRGVDALPQHLVPGELLATLGALGFAPLGVVWTRSRVPPEQPEEPATATEPDDDAGPASSPLDEAGWEVVESPAVMMVAEDGSAFAVAERDRDRAWLALYTLLTDGTLVRTGRRPGDAEDDRVRFLERLHASARLPGLRALLVRLGSVRGPPAYVDRPGVGYRQQVFDDGTPVARAWTAHRALVARVARGRTLEDHRDARLAVAVQRRSWHVLGEQMGWTGELADGWRRLSGVTTALALGLGAWSASGHLFASVVLAVLLVGLGHAAWGWCLGLDGRLPALLALGAAGTAWAVGLPALVTVALALAAILLVATRVIVWLALQSALVPWLLRRRRAPAPVPAVQLLWAYRD